MYISKVKLQTTRKRRSISTSAQGSKLHGIMILETVPLSLIRKIYHMQFPRRLLAGGNQSRPTTASRMSTSCRLSACQCLLCLRTLTGKISKKNWNEYGVLRNVNSHCALREDEKRHQKPSPVSQNVARTRSDRESGQMVLPQQQKRKLDLASSSLLGLVPMEGHGNSGYPWRRSA